jgi:protein-tyrosine phosphatase
MNRVDDYVYIGGIQAARDLNALLAEGITHVVNASDYETSCPYFKYLRIDIQDTSSTPIGIYYDTVYQFISDALATPNSKILIHCSAGISRSSTLVTMYLMRRYLVCPVHALDAIRRVRPIVHPNDGFMMSLRNYENVLASRHPGVYPTCRINKK